MRRISLLLSALLLILGLSSTDVQAQQMPISNMYIYHMHLFNPSMNGIFGRNKVFLSHQQRKVQFADKLSFSQVLNFNSSPFSRSRNLGWGIALVNDQEFTERRLQVGAGLSYHIISDATKLLSIGAQAGLINQGSSYGAIPVFDRNDPLVTNSPNITEIDASAGLYFLLLAGGNMLIELSGAMHQLPSLFTEESETNIGAELIPHLLVGGKIQFVNKDSIAIGPSVLYKEVYSADSVRSIGAAQVDANLRVDFLKKGLWFAGGYRIGNAAVNAGVGVRLFTKRDSTKKREVEQNLDLSAAFEYPLNETTIFGPTAELGLSFTFGRTDVGPEVIVIRDTFLVDRGPFWLSTSNINAHWDENMGEEPDGLIAYLDRYKGFVTIVYEFNDDVIQYDVENVPEIGELLRHIKEDVVNEGLNKTNKDYLEYLDYITLSAKMRFDTTNALSEINEKYQGEYGEEVNTVYFFDGERYVSDIKKEEFITNLELTLLKMISVRNDLAENLGLRKEDVGIKITSDNPNMGTYQKSIVTLRFKLRERQIKKGK